MYIVTSDKLINSDKIACFTVKSCCSLTERTNGGVVNYKSGTMTHELRAYCRAYVDENNNADYFLIGKYGTEDEAHKVLGYIMTALQNGAAGLDLR